jgi:hypothetical protein
MDAVFAQALEKSPEDRTLRAGIFASELRAAYEGGRAGNNSEGVTESMPPTGSSPYPSVGRPTSTRQSTMQLPTSISNEIWICNYCGYSFSGAKRNCPICTHTDLRSASTHGV